MQNFELDSFIFVMNNNSYNIIHQLSGGEIDLLEYVPFHVAFNQLIKLSVDQLHL